MKAVLFSILFLLCLVALCRGDTASCEHPLSMPGCLTKVTKNADNFCSTIGLTRKCLEEEAKCPSKVFDDFNKEMESKLGVKCDACGSPTPLAALLTALLTVLLARGTH